VQDGPKEAFAYSDYSTTTENNIQNIRQKGKKSIFLDDDYVPPFFLHINA
jgi:hypothetical protein